MYNCCFSSKIYIRPSYCSGRTWFNTESWYVLIYIFPQFVINECTQRKITTANNCLSHDTTAILCICMGVRTRDAVHPPQLFSLSQHQSSWCVTTAVGYCVTMWVMMCEIGGGVPRFSHICFAWLGVSVDSSFPELKPFFLGIYGYNTCLHGHMQCYFLCLT